MIEREHLYKLGYRIKTNRLYHGSSDFSHSDKNREYLVNHNNNKVNIIFAANINKKTIAFSDPKAFEDWHKEYK